MKTRKGKSMENKNPDDFKPSGRFRRLTTVICIVVGLTLAWFCGRSAINDIEGINKGNSTPAATASGDN